METCRWAFEIAPKKLGPRIWLKLRGEARAAVEHIKIEELAVEDGADKLLAVLDTAFSQLEVDRLEETYGRVPQVPPIPGSGHGLLSCGIEASKAPNGEGGPGKHDVTSRLRHPHAQGSVVDVRRAQAGVGKHDIEL